MGTSKYKLEQLGWFNFEQLVRTLLRELIGSGLSTFSGSIDQGRDATFEGGANAFPSKTDPWKGNWIFQVKHRTYSSRGADTVRSELKASLSDELAKITEKHEFDCDNYVFLTNCPFTGIDKDEMKSLVSNDFPMIQNFAFLGERDIDELLDSYPRVVYAFPQILGLSQLKELVQWGLHQRSLEFLLTAQQEIALFVATSPYLQAVDLLHKQHFCLLSGPPKMGKTCTAYALAASFSAQGFEIYDLRNQRDFYDAYDPEVKELFICDDVFGDISLHAAMRDDWSHGFVRLLSSLGSGHKLIWTAREYVLKEALSSSRLKEERPTLATTDKITVAVDQLTRLEKAMILYNHAKAANLPDHVKEYLKSRACLRIIDHENYSPETIRQLCTGRLVAFSGEAEGDHKEISSKVTQFLSQPGEAWKAAYLSAPEGERLLCTEIMAAGGAIPFSNLKKRYEKAVTSGRDRYPSFEASLTNATGTFLRIKPHYLGERLVQFYHPSMRDLLAELIQEDKIMRTSYLKQLTLKEVMSIAGASKGSPKASSQGHRVKVTDADDIALLKDHLSDNLLPSSTLDDMVAVLSEAISILGTDRIDQPSHKLHEGGEYPKTLWMILETCVPHACSKDFWRVNLEDSSVYQWRRFSEYLRKLLPLISIPTIPEYVPEMIRRLRDDKSVDFWGLVTATHSILPTVAEQCINFEDREICRKDLIEKVEEALSDARDKNLESDFDDSEYWHDTYGSLNRDCEDYLDLFPDDPPIEKVDEVAQTQEDFPRLEREPDYDQDFSDSLSSSSGTDSDILEIFSDL